MVLCGSQGEAFGDHLLTARRRSRRCAGYQNGDLKIRRCAQEKIISNIISAARLEEIGQKVGNADLIDRILVHRSFVMAALRLVAAYAQAEGGNKLENRDDFDVLGELALILNSVTDPAREQLTPCDIAAQIAPSREIENHPDLGLTLVRIERMKEHAWKAERAAQPFWCC